MKHISRIFTWTLALLPLMLLFSSCSNNQSLTPREKAIIATEGNILKCYTIDNQEDSLLLRSTSTNLTPADIKSPEYALLAQKMLATLDYEQGVGIAGAQVGILRKVAAVQRFDKEGEPVEVYANLDYEPQGDELQTGPEGCLSCGEARGDVQRYQTIKITYYSLAEGHEVSEIVTGFTAVIFQHEIDHFYGRLFIDRL